jgi:hypothetical protein
LHNMALKAIQEGQASDRPAPLRQLGGRRAPRRHRCVHRIPRRQRDRRCPIWHRAAASLPGRSSHLCRADVFNVAAAIRASRPTAPASPRSSTSGGHRRRIHRRLPWAGGRRAKGRRRESRAWSR